ncbi:MAG TPA: S41 family peptidase [Pyrinomonadaceae bacterium]|jgi:carboxyl-terminal processing protease
MSEPSHSPYAVARASSRASLAARLILCCLLLAPCLASCRRARQNAAPPAPSLTAEERLRLFDEIWHTIDEGFYDPSFNGVDWRAVGERYRPRIAAARDDFEFYGLCELLAAELRDSHTRFEPPPPPQPEPAPGATPQAEQGSARMLLGWVEGEVAVVEVEPDSAAARGGVRPGMIVRAVNGRPVGEIEAELRRLVAGASSENSLRNLIAGSILNGRVWGVPRVLRLADAEGREFDYEVRRQPVADSARLEARRLASGFAYLKFDQWKPPVDQKFDDALDALRAAPGLVVDLRRNGGGQTDVMLNITSNFFAEATYYGGFKTRAGGVDKYFTHKPARVYEKPVVILVDERSASASETSTLFMQEVGRARVVGAQSAGSTHNARVVELPRGAKLHYSIRAYLTPKGRDPEGTGVLPDEPVPLTLSDLRAGRDAALEAAERALSRLTTAGGKK